ncbi:MAG: divalent metal cation transporter [Gammaproteobacteria bacterium]|nr:divalent metal cation transporter [Gammaproteobacteria bacterium]
MNNNQTLTYYAATFRRIPRLLQCLGPGILMAAAAIGASHLAASTQAGARFGWQLVGLILLAHLLKYPFFKAGASFTLATGKSLQQGYLQQGKGYLYIFTAVNGLSAIASIAGVSMLTAAMLSLFLPLSVNMLSGIVLTVCLITLLIGQYKLLDGITKLTMLCLLIITCAALLLAILQGPVADSVFVSPSPWQLANMGFIIALIGWMPAPIEVSCWNSLWLLEKQKQLPITKRQGEIDFTIGYFLTAFLAIVFLSLGTLVMHGSGQSFEAEGSAFANQLVNMYSQVMGSQFKWLISSVALLCIFSTTITALDGYGRTLGHSFSLLKSAGTTTAPQRERREQRINALILVSISLLAITFIQFFSAALLTLLQWVMTLAFLNTVIFGWLNLQLMTSNQLGKEQQFGQTMRALACIGLFFAASITAFFIFQAIFT